MDSIKMLINTKATSFSLFSTKKIYSSDTVVTFCVRVFTSFSKYLLIILISLTCYHMTFYWEGWGF